MPLIHNQSFDMGVAKIDTRQVTSKGSPEKCTKYIIRLIDDLNWDSKLSWLSMGLIIYLVQYMCNQHSLYNIVIVSESSNVLFVNKHILYILITL